MFKIARYCLAYLAFAVGISAVAQDLPLNPQVRTGTLSNGLQYFIQRNPKPEKRVELRLAIKAGSILEDDNQLGLAHFTEHMCFNGTKNFPKNDLVSYLQTAGVRFVADLNAYTSFDETVYMLPVPSDKEETVDKGLQILEDWAHNVTFEGTEIDKERGVVIEEWRTRRGAGQRMRDQWLPAVYKGSRYADRLPIGTKEILEKFDHATIRKFYKDWYRPDLMAVIVVGDIDVDKMEAKIKTYFNRLEASKNPRERKEYDVPAHPETRIQILSDKESPSNAVRVTYKHASETVRTEQDFRRRLLYSLYENMLYNRLDEISKKPDPAYIFAYAGYGGGLSKNSSEYESYAQVPNEKIEEALKTLLVENRRVQQHGFQKTELERAIKDVLSRYEKDFNESNKTDSEVWVDKYVYYFLQGSPAMDAGYAYELAKKFLPTVQTEELSTLAKKWITKENRSVIITTIDKPSVKLPTEARVRALLDEVDNMNVSPYEDKVITEPLMAKMPQAGKIVKETPIAKSEGATEFVLSNGATVVIKPTTYKNDEVEMKVYSEGGTSLYPDTDKYNASMIGPAIMAGGIGNFSPTDLQKVLAGKNVFIYTSVGWYEEGMSCNTTLKDFETALQLMHLYFTAPRKDVDLFKAFITKNKASVKNWYAEPQIYFGRETGKIMTQNHPRANAITSEEDYDKVNYDRVLEIYKERFGNASDFVFTFVGNIDIEKVRPLLETYIGSLPTQNKKEKYKDLGIRPPQGFLEKEVKKGKDPKSQVTMNFVGNFKNDKDELALKAFGDLLRIKITENLREDKGGVYSPRTNTSVSRIPYSRFNINVNFGCAPENVGKLTEAVFEEIGKLQNVLPTAEDMKKIKETYRREMERNVQENYFWTDRLERAYKFNQKLISVEESKARYEAITPQDIQRIAKKYPLKKNLIKIVLNPEK
ncbi:MAG: insulinase family protein [Bacteroidetes bacterium]|nr:MAG: insulinase family protein [Bacteroidota bacterium]